MMRINLLVEKWLEFSFSFEPAWQWLEALSFGRQVMALFFGCSSWPKPDSYPWTLWLASDKQYMRNSLSEAFLGFKLVVDRNGQHLE